MLCLSPEGHTYKKESTFQEILNCFWPKGAIFLRKCNSLLLFAKCNTLFWFILFNFSSIILNSGIFGLVKIYSLNFLG